MITTAHEPMPILTPVPQEAQPEAPRHRRRNTHAIVGYSLAGALAVALAATSAVALGTLQERDTMIASQHEELNAISDRLATVEDERAECEAEAQAYRDASLSLATSFYDYLQVMPWGTLDTTEAEAALDEANELGCLS